jgi:hypothetical protein
MTYSPQFKEQKTTTTTKAKMKTTKQKQKPTTATNKTKGKKRESRLLFYDYLAYFCWLLTITLMILKKNLPQH